MTSDQGKRRRLEVFRYHPETMTSPLPDYEVPFHGRLGGAGRPQLHQRRGGRHPNLPLVLPYGVCGSCGMMVNGEPKLTCAAFLRIIRHHSRRAPDQTSRSCATGDQLDDFLHKLQEVKAWMIHKEEKPVAAGEYLQTPEQLAQYKQYSMCINCMLCYSACPVYGLEPKFLGPAAIALAQRYNLDSRDGAEKRAGRGCFLERGNLECTFIGECTRVCPKHVDPAGAIQQAR